MQLSCNPPIYQEQKHTDLHPGLTRPNSGKHGKTTTTLTKDLSAPTLSSQMEEHYRIIKYKPNVAGNIVIGGLYAIQSFVFLFYIIRHKDKWALCLPLGAIASSIGYFLRLSLDPENVSLILYVLQSMFIIATPSAFLAFNYMLYGRLLTAIDPQFGPDKSHSKMEKSRYSCIPPQIVGRVFIISDITTFLIQVAAGGMLGAAGGNNPSLAKFGDTLYLVGVCAQGACYFLFTVLLTVTLMRLVAERQRAGADRFGKSWMGLDHNTLITASALYFSSLFITVSTLFQSLFAGHFYTQSLIDY